MVINRTSGNDMIRPYSRLLAVAVLAAPSLFLAVPAARADEAITIAISKDHKFVPAEITAPAGQRIKITVRNEGTANSEFESSDFHREKVVLAGKEISVFVGPLDPGTYEFFDDFHPETRGHLTVK